MRPDSFEVVIEDYDSGPFLEISDCSQKTLLKIVGRGASWEVEGGFKGLGSLVNWRQFVESMREFSGEGEVSKRELYRKIREALLPSQQKGFWEVVFSEK